MTMNDTEKQKALIYTRVAQTAVEHPANTLATQEAKCRSFAETNQYVVTNVFHDVGSGNSSSRPGFEAMLEFIAQNKQDKHCVLIGDPTRLARRAETLLNMRQKILEAGASIKFAERLSPQLENRARSTGRQRER
jgi:site-specific DNA recombinase